MFTPTPSSPAVSAPPYGSGDWQVVNLELIVGPKGRAAVAWMAAGHPLRMRWNVGARVFKDIESARRYASTIVGVPVDDVDEH